MSIELLTLEAVLKLSDGDVRTLARTVAQSAVHADARVSWLQLLAFLLLSATLVFFKHED